MTQGGGVRNYRRANRLLVLLAGTRSRLMGKCNALRARGFGRAGPSSRRLRNIWAGARGWGGGDALVVHTACVAHSRRQALRPRPSSSTLLMVLSNPSRRGRGCSFCAGAGGYLTTHSPAAKSSGRAGAPSWRVYELVHTRAEHADLGGTLD